MVTPLKTLMGFSVHLNVQLKFYNLPFSKTTIFNEVHRLAGEYHAVKAQTDHEVKLSHRGRGDMIMI